MSRLIHLTVLTAILGAVFLLPRPDAVRLAAAQAGSLLLEPTREGRFQALADEDPEASAQEAAESDALPLWRTLLDGSASEDESGFELRVRGYRMVLDRTGWKDQRLHARMFESLERGLRAISAEHGFELRTLQRLNQSFDGVALVCTPADGQLVLEAQLPDGTVVHAARPWHPTGAISVAPSLLAIAVAMLFRKPLLALALGVLAGAVLERGIAGSSWFGSLGLGSARIVTDYLPGELSDPGRQQILLFVVCMLAMVGVITRSGGVRGLMARLEGVARDARRSQIATYLMGLVIFFDHYANAVLVGTTMRPLTDRFKVAREKLAYLVDSTAAPVAGLSIFSTWIAFEVSTFSPQLPVAGLASAQGYEVFLRTLPFRFYSLLTLFFVGLVVFSGRDFGPMRRAEQRARTGEVLRKGARPLAARQTVDLQPAAGAVPRASTALWPLAAFLATTVVTILVRGGAFASGGAGSSDGTGGLATILFAGSGPAPLALGSLVGLGVALVLGARAGLGRRVFGAGVAGVRAAAVALALLGLAWMIGAVCRDLGTAAYISVVLQEALNPLLLPIILFLLSGAIAFATGSSWSTMTILLPLVVGIAADLGQSTPIGSVGMLVVAIASVLEGAIFGDHCSPISDTTVMSSIAASSDHVDHVRTQAPYALLTMAVALACGFYPAVILGLSPWLSLALGAAVLTGMVFYYGKRPGAQPEEERTASGSRPNVSADARSAA